MDALPTIINGDEISRAELEAIADNILGPDTPARRLWASLHDPRMMDGRHRLSVLALRAGYQHDDRSAPHFLRAVDTPPEVRRILGLIEDAGIARARASSIMTGLSAAGVMQTLSRLLKAEDHRVAVRAADVASKVLGMQQQQRGGGINVYAPSATSVCIDARSLMVDIDD